MTSSVDSIKASFKTIVEMLDDRGYGLGIDKNSMSETIDENFTKTAFVIPLPKDVYVIYHMGTKFKFQEVKKFLDLPEMEDARLIILVHSDASNSVNTKNLNQYKNIEIHNIRKLQINISKHELVPKHEVVRSPEEIQSVLDQFCLKNKYQLPVILKSDAMARYLGLCSGDIVKITRSSPTAGIYTVFRVCV